MLHLEPFVNEPVLELRRAAVRARLPDALAALDARLPLRVPLAIGSDERFAQALVSTDPGAPDRVVALAPIADERDVEAAVATAARAATAWRDAGAARRAEALVRAAAWMRERRLELAALAVRECAKPWPEADADVCEAIDFLEYYARGAIALERGRELLQAPGERNMLRYVARGVVAVVAPWNFPLAIPCGMTAAALAVGNAVVLKPAEQAPGCAMMLLRALRAGGVPVDALSLLPGEQATGSALVRDPRIAVVAFTGSQAVGLEIVRAAAEPSPARRGITQVVAELGGKNCVIVDADADLDEAVPEIVASAFGYAGQKCSAAARVLVAAPRYEDLARRLAGAVELLAIGQAQELGIDVPPLIERAARDRVLAYGKAALSEGRVLAGSGSPTPAQGWFCPPLLVTDLPAGSRLLNEEIFGPLLTVEPVRDLDEALEVVDALPVALTGGLFTRNPESVRQVQARSPVGNLYVNRGTTGAMVGRQPFGGNRLSGTGGKAGGPDYLLQFVEPRVVTENTMRHGLEV